VENPDRRKAQTDHERARHLDRGEAEYGGSPTGGNLCEALEKQPAGGPMTRSKLKI